MTDIDYESLNHEAKILFDHASAHGKRRGSEETRSELADDKVRDNVELVVRMLESSVSARDQYQGDDDHNWPERVLALHARSLLGRTPAYPDVSHAHHRLGRVSLNNAPGGIKRKLVDDVLRDLKRYHEHLVSK